MSIPRLHHAGLAAAASLGLAHHAATQCILMLQPGPTGLNGVVRAIASWDSDGAGPLPPAMVVAGNFTLANGAAMNRIARWDDASQSWTPLGTGLNGMARCLLARSNGDLIVGGDFQSAGGIACAGIARWDGSSWSALGSGVANPGLVPYVYALAETAAGDLIAGGLFTLAGGNAVNHIARWDGSSWSSLGGGSNGLVTALAIAANGDLIAGGSFTQLGGAPANRIGRWSNGAWSAIGGGQNSSVEDVIARRDGSIVACSGPGVSVFDGQNWIPLVGTGSLYMAHLFELPNGDVVASGFGSFGGSFADHVLRWNGSAWASIGSSNNEIATLAMIGDGALWIGGQFLSFNGLVTPKLAQLTSTCPAVADPYGSGCSGAGGTLRLRATTLPWLGGRVDTAVDGLPGSSLALVLRGFATTSVPLLSLLPQGAPGCELLVQPTLIDALLLGGSAGSASLSLPASLSLAGVQWLEQWLAFDLGLAPQAGSLIGSNGLQFTAGVF
jgi:hypothetical protein